MSLREIVRELAMDFLNSWPVMIGLCLCFAIAPVITLAVGSVLLLRNANRRQ